MATGFLTPDARLRIVTDLGVVAPGAKLNTYVGGTPSTPLATYSDEALTTPNTNPVVASAGGLFGPIYLTKGVSYKFALTDSAGAPIWTQDLVKTPADNTLAAGTGISLATAAGVTTITNSAATLAPIGTNNFRLTLESGVPVSATDQLAKGTLFCTPYTGNRIDLYDGSGVPTTLSSAQFSIAVPAATSQLYDVFAYNNAGVATLELLAWTNDTTRATAIVQTTTGAWTKSGDLTRRYLGSMRTTTVANQTEDSAAKRFVWNHYNRVRRTFTKTEAAASWTYSTNTIRALNNSTTNRVEAVIGVADIGVVLTFAINVASDSATLGEARFGFGLDSTTTLAANQVGATVTVGGVVSMQYIGVVTWNSAPLAVGYHFFQALEQANVAAATATWRASGTSPGLGVITGWIDG